jgi:hypothetical protein
VENSPLSSWAGDFSQAPSPVTSYAPSARYGAPFQGPPLVGTPAYPPFSQGPHQPSSPTTFPTHNLRQGSGLRLVTAAIPLSNTRGFSRPHPLLITWAQGTRHPLNPPSPTPGGRARPPIRSLPATSGTLPLHLGTGLTTPRPSPLPLAHP